MTQPCHHGGNRLWIHLASPLVCLKHGTQQIARLEKCINHIGTQHKFLLANTIKQVLKNVCCVSQIGKTEGACAALDRVCRPKNGIELLHIRIFKIQIEQQRLHCRQMLLGLLEEHLIELTHIDSHATP